jgi:hypothetical protein
MGKALVGLFLKGQKVRREGIDRGASAGKPADHFSWYAVSIFVLGSASLRTALARSAVSAPSR